LSSSASERRSRSARGQAPPAGRGIAAPATLLPIGSPLPEFTLEGIDGKMHKSSIHEDQGARHPVRERPLPVSINYEARAEELYRTYRDRG
jgi:hypothetical protein